MAPASNRKKKRKLSDRQVVERTRHFLPESRVFSQLVEFEQRIDAVVERKRLEYQDMVGNLERIPATLRVRTWCEPTEGGFVVRVAGRLIKETTDGASTSSESLGSDAPPMSQLLSKLEVVMQQPDGEAETATWSAPSAEEASRGEPERIGSFEVRRAAPIPTAAHVLLHVKHEPELVSLPQGLADLFGMPHATRAAAATSLWQYLKLQKLQNASDPSVVDVDDALAHALGLAPSEKRIRLPMLAQKLTSRLEKLPPVRIDVHMPTSTTPELVYDVEVSLAGAMRTAQANEWQRVAGRVLAPNLAPGEEDDEDRRIAKAMQAIQERLRRRAFYLGFAHSPADFVAALCASQARDLRVMAIGQSRGQTGQHARSRFYELPWAEEAAMRYLRRSV